MATNVALSSNGGTATASSTLGAGYEATRANNGNRTGATYGTDGAWVDNTPWSWDDWLQVEFNASYTINQIDLFGVQDNYTSPSTPTLTMTSSLYGLKDFEIQYWTGSAWSTVSGGNVAGNNNVWTEFTFTAVATTKVRVLIHASQDGYSRVAELEAWTAPSAPGAPSSPSPANGATGISLSPTLSWSSSGATSYDVYFGTSGSPPLVSSDQIAATYTTGTLAASTVYNWKIVAKNSGGSTTGSIWSFTTTSGSMATSTKPTPAIEVELGGVGAGWTDITSDVLRSPDVIIRHGIQGSGPGDHVASTGTARFSLDNSTQNSAATLGYYSLYHASKRSGWALGIGCRIRLQDPNTGTIYTRFVGRIDAIDPEPGTKGPRTVAVTATDWMDEAARWNLTPDIGEQIGQRADEILTDIVAQMPRQPTSTSFDVGTEAYSYALDTSQVAGQPALSEFAKLAASEFGFIYQKGDGTLRFEGRHSRLLDTSSDWTITESNLQSLELPSTRSEVINTVRVTVHPKIVDSDPTTLIYDQANVIAIASGTTQLLIGPFRDPVTGDPIGATDVQTQIAGTDYIANTNDGGTGTDITADLDVVVTIGQSGARFEITNNNAATAYLTRNVLYGKGIYDRGTMQFQARDSLSVAAIGEQVVNFDMPYQDDDDVGQGAATYILSKYSSAIAQARRITVVATSSTLLAQILAREISDRLTISETLTGLNSSYFINGIELRLLKSGHIQGTYTLAPAADPFSGLYWQMDVSQLDLTTLVSPI